MQAGHSAALRRPDHARHGHHYDRGHLGYLGASLRCGARPLAVKGFRTPVFGVSRPAAVQKDVTSDLIERAFALALTTRLKQHAGIHVDVRSTAWGLMEGKFGGMTVRGYNWRTPLELTADQLMVDVGELVLDYQKLVWQQTVALKNIPQGSVAFTLTSQDLANFMVHPIMVAAAARAVQGHEFIFDRSTASVRLDPATGRGVLTYQGIWAADGQRYAVTMSTPPPTAAPYRSVMANTATAGRVSALAPSNTLEQLTVSARRIVPASAAKSTTGSYASMGSVDTPLLPVAAGTAGQSSVGGWQPVPGAPLAGTGSAAATASTATGAGAALLSSTSQGGYMDGDDGDADELSAPVVAEGLRRFFSTLKINLQGIELRNPVLLVQLPGQGVGAAGGSRSPVPLSGPLRRPTSIIPGSASVHEGATGLSGAALQPALLTITMKIAILQLPPLNMKF